MRALFVVAVHLRHVGVVDVLVVGRQSYRGEETHERDDGQKQAEHNQRGGIRWRLIPESIGTLGARHKKEDEAHDRNEVEQGQPTRSIEVMAALDRQHDLQATCDEIAKTKHSVCDCFRLQRPSKRGANSASNQGK